MKILITAASPWSGLDDTAVLLAQAGLQPAQPAPVGPEVFQSVGDWHTQLLQTLDLHPQGLNASAPLPVGKLWEDMAVGLLRANLGQADWFLADTRATWVLDFWGAIDPQARFLLLYLPAEAALQSARLHALADDTAPAGAWDATACAQAWLQHNRQLLRLARAQPARTLLVNTQQAVLHPQRLVSTLAGVLGVQPATAGDLSQWDAPIYLSASIEALVAPALAAELRAMNRQLREAQTPLQSGGTQLVLATGSEAGHHKGASLLGWLGKGKQTEQALAQLHTELAHTQADLGHAQDIIATLASKKERLQQRLASAEHAQRSTQAALDQAQGNAQKKSDELAQARHDLTLVTAQLHQLRTELDHQKAELQTATEQADQTAQQANILQQAHARQAAELQQESELLLLQLKQAQEELESTFNESQSLAHRLDATEQARHAAEQAKAVAEQARAAAERKAAEANQQAQAAHAAKTQAEQGRAAAEKAKAAAEQARAAAEKKAAEANQQAQAAHAAKAQAEQGRAAAEQAKAHAEQARAAAEKKAIEASQQAQAANAAKEKATAALVSQQQLTETAQAELANAKKSLQQLTAKADDTTQENELLLLQLMQAQEELVDYFDRKNELEKLYEAYKARWDRLEKRLPNYVDFGVIDIAAFDHTAAVPSVTWRVKDFAYGNTVVPEFTFQTVLDQGHPGLGLCPPDAEPGPVIVPMQLARDAAQLQRFRSLGTQAFLQLQAGAAILEQLETAQWQGFPWPAGFDPGFWRPSLKLLVSQFKQLPPALRFNEARLKRELVNPDYEHLWLELLDLSVGTTRLKKLEVRLGASNIQPGGFSRYPKFEIPLIDGKHKPFDSWFAESHDEHGAKLELRFALDQQALDRAVLAQLSESDRLFLLRIVQIVPQALRCLEAQQTAIHRPWAQWQAFAQEAVDVIAALQKASAPPPASISTAPPAPAEPVLAKTVEPAGLSATPPLNTQAAAAAKAPRQRNQATKVISLGAQPAPRSKPSTKTPRTKASA